MSPLLRNELDSGKVEYGFTNKKAFFPMSTIKPEDINAASDFAYRMTFGGEGEHRGNRTGGRKNRNNGEKFLNVFNGKLGEFAFKRYLEQQGFEVPPVDLEVYGRGRWDTADFVLNDLNLSVKTVKHFSNLLLLEAGDWDAEGRYIPNINAGGGNYNYHILVRLKGNKDLEKELRASSKLYSELTQQEIEQLLKGYKVSFDLPGVATQEMLVGAIRNNHIIRKDEYLTTTKMDADNYYIQAGNLVSIEILLNPIE